MCIILGHLNEPKYNHSKRLRTTIKSMETILTKGDNTTEEFEDGISVCAFINYSISIC